MATLLDELRALVSSLERNGIELLCAAAWQGRFMVMPEQHSTLMCSFGQNLWNWLTRWKKRHGYEIRGLDISFKERAVEIRLISKIDDEGEVLSLDLLLVTPHVEDVWASKERLTSAVRN